MALHNILSGVRVMFSWNTSNFYVACSASDVKTGVETITGCPRKSPDILVQIRPQDVPDILLQLALVLVGMGCSIRVGYTTDIPRCPGCPKYNNDTLRMQCQNEVRMRSDLASLVPRPHLAVFFRRRGEKMPHFFPRLQKKTARGGLGTRLRPSYSDRLTIQV